MSSSEEVRKTLGEGKYKRLVAVNDWEFMERVKNTDVVAVLAVNAEGKLLLVEQYRVPVGKNVIELPAGLSNDLAEHPDESLEDAARRELLEESGYEAGRMTPILRGPLSAASVSEMMTLFRAEGLRKVGEGGGDPTENITAHEVPVDEVYSWLRRRETEGALVDPKVYGALYFLAKC